MLKQPDSLSHEHINPDGTDAVSNKQALAETCLENTDGGIHKKSIKRRILSVVALVFLVLLVLVAGRYAYGLWYRYQITQGMVVYNREMGSKETL